MGSFLKLASVALLAATVGCASTGYVPSTSPDSATVQGRFERHSTFVFEGYRLANVDGKWTDRSWTNLYEQEVTLAPGAHQLVVEVGFSQGFDWMARGPYTAYVPIAATLKPATTYRLMGAISSNRVVEAWLEDAITKARVSAPAAAKSRENPKTLFIPPLPPKR